jgi:hypothetical protein
MKNAKTIILFCCLLLGWWTLSLKAQNGTVAAGGDMTGSGGSVSYSIGQVDYITVSGSGGTITQGLQQPYEIWVITGMEVPGIELSMIVYPNPTSDFVMLRIDDSESFREGALTYSLYDVKGQMLDRQAIGNLSNRIGLSDFTNGIYFIKVHENERELKVFKVIKNQ